MTNERPGAACSPQPRACPRTAPRQGCTQSGRDLSANSAFNNLNVLVALTFPHSQMVLPVKFAVYLGNCILYV